MSDQANGQGAGQAAGQDSQQDLQPGAAHQPSAENQALSGRVRTAPLIEGEAVDVTESHPQTEAASSESAAEVEKASEAEADGAQKPASEANEPTASETAPSREKPVANGARLLPLAALAGVAALGVGLYFSWDQITHTGSPTRIAEAPGAVTPKALPAPETEAPKAEAPVSGLSQAEDEKPAMQPADSNAPPRADIDKDADKDAGGAESPKSVETSAEATKPHAADTSAELGQNLAGKLAATQLALAQVTQRVQALEVKLAAPKAESRAALSAPDAAGSKAGDASVRIVLAQNLLTALRQGDDFAPALAGLQNLGADPVRLAKWRAGLAAPSTKQLAADFAALAPKLVSAAEAATAPAEAKPANFGESVLAYVSSRAKKLVKVRAIGAPADETAEHVDRAEKALDRGDLAAALTETSALPEKARALAADWSKEAQVRADAEEAAKSELADAFKGLSKPRN